MLDTSSPASPEELVVAIEIVPVEEEEDDLDTLVTVGRVHAEIYQEATHLEGYSVKSAPTNERGIEIILIGGMIASTIMASKDLLTSFFQMISTVIEWLAKRERVEEIEIIADGKTLILRDLHKKAAKELIEAFEAQHPGATTTLTTGATLKVKAKVSKKSRTKK